MPKGSKNKIDDEYPILDNATFEFMCNKIPRADLVKQATCKLTEKELVEMILQQNHKEQFESESEDEEKGANNEEKPAEEASPEPAKPAIPPKSTKITFIPENVHKTHRKMILELDPFIDDKYKKYIKNQKKPLQNRIDPVTNKPVSSTNWQFLTLVQSLNSISRFD